MTIQIEDKNFIITISKLHYSPRSNAINFGFAMTKALRIRKSEDWRSKLLIQSVRFKMSSRSKQLITNKIGCLNAECQFVSCTHFR